MKVKSEEKRCNSAKVRREKRHARLKVREVAKCCVFSMIRVSGESKSRLVKAAGAEVCRQRRNQKLHAVVARSTFPSQNVQNTCVLPHFLTFRCREISQVVS